MTRTNGLNHLGLTVRDLNQTTAFFVDCLGWTETARDPVYPRSTVTDGALRLTLWQAKSDTPIGFDRHANVGLHHLALTVDSDASLNDLASAVAAYPGTKVEFMPEDMGQGPRRHMMFREPGGLRIELTWPGP